MWNPKIIPMNLHAEQTHRHKKTKLCLPKGKGREE